jgi:type II secretory pathway component PulK
MTRRTASGRGFALLTVLWVIAGASAIAATAALDTISTTEGARNRIAKTRAEWITFGCAEQVRWLVDGLLEAAADEAARRDAWLDVPSRVTRSTRSEPLPCDIEWRAVGARVNLAALDATGWRTLLGSVSGLQDRESMVAAALDWTDPDDLARPGGAEHDWYRGAARIAPRNGAMVAVEELGLVRGFESAHGTIAGLVTTDTHRVAINVAPRPVLLTLPGIGEEVAQRLLARRAAGQFVSDHRDLLSDVSDDASQAILRRFAELVERSVVDPPAWTIRVRAISGAPAVEVAMDVTLARGTRHVVVVQRELR